MRVMTKALSRANWSGVPSLNQPWLVALLCMIAMLWSNVAATFRTCLAVAERRRRMSPSRYARECDTQPAPAALPRETHDILETEPAAASSQPHEALMVSSTRSVRLSNRERRSASADELIQWINSSSERPERKRRAGELTGGCSLERTLSPRPRRRPGPSNHVASCSDLRLPPHGGTSLIVSTGSRPWPGTRPLALRLHATS
jgi:hypothetical protein